MRWAACWRLISRSRAAISASSPRRPIWRRHHARRQPDGRLARDRAGAGLGRRRFFFLLAPVTPPAHAAARREPAQVVEHAGPALTARERTVERRKRAGKAVVLVIDPGA